MQMGLPIGSMLAIGAAAIVDRAFGGMEGLGWRVLYIVGVLPIIVIALLARNTPESPLWQQRGSRSGLDKVPCDDTDQLHARQDDSREV